MSVNRALSDGVTDGRLFHVFSQDFSLYRNYCEVTLFRHFRHSHHPFNATPDRATPRRAVPKEH